MSEKQRIIGERSGSLHGPLLIVLTCIHGNEPAGYLAIEEVFRRIDAEYQQKTHFNFRGKIVGMVGNLAAARQAVRFQKTDLNRIWSPENVQRIRKTDKSILEAEELELYELIEYFEALSKNYSTEKIVILDLHTTTAQGGIFVIPSKDEKSGELAQHIHAPVLHGFLDDILGTALHHFSKQNYPNLDLTSLCFESGQHNSPDSIDHAVSAIIQCFLAIGGFYPEDIETKHEKLLAGDAASLPKEARLIYSHRIQAGDDFAMRSDKIYRNFDPVEEGELLATDRNGKIFAKCKGLILMPLYQKQGNDGFFIIQDMNEAAPKLYPNIPSSRLNA
jgi:succinylglutamate desuccinylase